MKRSINIRIIDQRLAEHYAPGYATEGAAGIDLRACIHKPLCVQANQSILVPTGIAVHLADTSLAGLVLPRSGLGHQHGLVLGNLVGLIDSDYQGEIQISLWNRSELPYTVAPLERVAQLLIVQVHQVKLNMVEAFASSTQRGACGFGSTGT